VRGDQGGVVVDDQRPVGVDAVIRGVLSGGRPHPCPSRRARRINRGQCACRVRGERGNRA
jgi:hypothetical protein